MTITTDNYEEYFYRYCEGELATEERAAVEAFAAQHPELAEELSLYDPDLKLEEAPLPYPDKERLLRHEGKVVPLWRWAAAACVAAVLVGGVWLLWPDGKPTVQTGMVAQTRQPAPEVTTVIPASQQEVATPTPAPKTDEQATPPAMQPSPVQDEPVEPLLQYEAPAFEEPALLAEAEPTPLLQGGLHGDRIYRHHHLPHLSVAGGGGGRGLPAHGRRPLPRLPQPCQQHGPRLCLPVIRRGTWRATHPNQLLENNKKVYTL